MSVRVVVPASTSNLGPGFDVLGLALDIVNEVTATPRRDATVTINLDGGATGSEDADLSNPATNMVARAWTLACERMDVAASVSGVDLACVNRIPMARGLGSSAAAALAGVLAARAIHHGHWTDDEVLALVTELEGHPDNAAAALLGGLVICAGGSSISATIAQPLRAVLFIPEFRMPTQAARAVVPESIPRADAVFNLGRCVALVHALEHGHHEHLRVAMEDRWHQSQRATMFPAMPRLIDAALAAGARGACLSGAGPTILALCDGESGAVAQSMRAMAHVSGVAGTTMDVALRLTGATVETRP